VVRNDRNIGEVANLARVVSLARGEYFRLTAHDDLCAPTLLTECVTALVAAGPGAVLAYPRTMIIDDDGTELGPWDDAVELRAALAWLRVARYAHKWNLCNQMFAVMRTDRLRRVNMQCGYVGADVTMLTELAALGRFVEVPRRLFYRRMHTASTVQSGRTSAELLRQLEPAAAEADRKDRGPSLILRTARALLRTRLPAATRWSCAVAFVASSSVREARVRWGRAWRRAAGRPLPTAPWEARSRASGAG
jgi:hypothetical protein